MTQLIEIQSDVFSAQALAALGDHTEIVLKVSPLTCGMLGQYMFLSKYLAHPSAAWFQIL